MLLSLPMTGYEWHERHKRWLNHLTVLNTYIIAPLGIMGVAAGVALLAVFARHALALGLILGGTYGLGCLFIAEGVLLVAFAGTQKDTRSRSEIV